MVLTMSCIATLHFSDVAEVYLAPPPPSAAGTGAEEIVAVVRSSCCHVDITSAKHFHLPPVDLS